VAAAKKHSKQLCSSLSFLISISSNSESLRNLLTLEKEDAAPVRRQNSAAEAEFRALRRRVLQRGGGHGATASTAATAASTTAASAAAARADAVPAGSKEKKDATAGQYAEALGTRRSNAVGMYNEYGDEIGLSLLPVLCLVNHSCLPNCQQVTADGACSLLALRDIAPGEELSYSYVSLLGAVEERQGSLLKNWGFTCRCARCVGAGAPAAGGGDLEAFIGAFDAAHVCACGAVCLVVNRDTGECICNPSRA
jgi:hypothetical protein